MQQPTLRNNYLLTYNFIKNNPSCSQRDLTHFLHIKRATVQESLFPLIDMGYIKEKVINNKGKKAYWIDKRRKVEL